MEDFKKQDLSLFSIQKPFRAHVLCAKKLILLNVWNTVVESNWGYRRNNVIFITGGGREIQDHQFHRVQPLLHSDTFVLPHFFQDHLKKRNKNKNKNKNNACLSRPHL